VKYISRYRKKLFIYLFLTFVVFTAIIIYWEYHREKKYRIKSLNSELNGYTDLVKNYINIQNSYPLDYYQLLDTFYKILPNKNLRISIIDLSGSVVYDSQVKGNMSMENHARRPEVIHAILDGIGSDIRISTTTKLKYYYYAKRYNNDIIRISILYDIEAKNILEPDKLSLIFIFLFFLISSISFIFITDKFGSSIVELKKFITLVSTNKPIDEDFYFPQNELGIIGKAIITNYQNLDKVTKELLLEKEKLIRHLNILQEGIAIFSKDKNMIITNSHFVQFINYINDKLVSSNDKILEIEELSPIKNFIENQTQNTVLVAQNPPSHEIIIKKNRKIFSIKCIIFQDMSFEILINNITKLEKRKLLKQQLTDNIAHELKTPVSSIRGFLETIQNNDLDQNKQSLFIQRAYSQTCRLAELIEDISLLTTIEESRNLYKINKINLYQIIQDVIYDLQLKIEKSQISVDVLMAKNFELYGNYFLIYSAFRNLFDNTIAYAGNNVSIKINKYMEDSEYYYFSYYDSGIGVPEVDLQRLFERFYRVEKGRDRKNGGTGLGLAIVKNTILYHKGEITVRNRNEGGLEFLFSIHKYLDTQIS
jgi:two-component system phosphate regulon sensor histidine kinase PhoR